MKKLGLIIVILLIAGLGTLLFLSNQESENDQERNNETNEESEEVNEEPKEEDDNVEEKDLTFSLEEVNSGNSSKEFNYIVKNEGADEVELSFNTSQRYEYELSSKEEGVIKRYSDGKAFMQVLKDIKLAPGEELSYDISLSSLNAGEYTLRVFLTARDMSKSEKTISFKIDE
ncbi:BsuPI-related putative proteinase inhibitor [Virgibacillus profundi]|nr:BsuPI-related putative proteinase inhibitor [Virgibacillus profundi]